jgi:hypothetical protein
MSETLGEFAQPLFSRLPSATADSWREDLGVAVVVWDGVVLGDPEDKIIERVADLCARSDAPMIVPELIERKRTLFADDMRYVVGFDTYERGGRVHIVAMTVRE